MTKRRITNAYLAAAYAFAQIRPIGRTSDMRQPLDEIAAARNGKRFVELPGLVENGWEV